MPVGLDLLAERSLAYENYERSDIVSTLDPPLGRVLDVGCARGGAADVLRSLGATHLTGIELDEEGARVAQNRYDSVLHGSIESDLPWGIDSFDTILCYDVLEHLYDPWTVVRRLVPLLAPDGRFHVSAPNSRNVALWRPLVIHGTFPYAPSGLGDVTHIRFFTRTDMIAMLDAAGLDVISVSATGGASLKRRLAAVLSAGLAKEFFAYQWVVLASRYGSHDATGETLDV
jgi:2-polyprenyl-3-methyl-5-hydroxy-6-metoxy-1,4-benzoquinol methylase